MNTFKEVFDSSEFHFCSSSCFGSLDAIRLPSAQECVNKDEAKVQFVKNINKSGGARQAGSGHGRPRRIPVPDQANSAAQLRVPANRAQPDEELHFRSGR